MLKSDWGSIIQQIKNCRRKASREQAVECLKELFLDTNDGMVAMALGEEFEERGDIVQAGRYYEKACELFPMPQYKQKAVQKLENLRWERSRISEEDTHSQNDIPEAQKRDIGDDLLSKDPISTLIIVPCTKSKIWDISHDAPEFVPARSAYTGKSFREFISWAERNEIEKKGFNWIILSGKYGFLEPWHPISFYDIAISDESAFPITDCALKNQAKQIRWRRDRGEGRRKVRLAQYENIVCVNCSEPYLEKIRLCFPESRIEEARV